MKDKYNRYRPEILLASLCLTIFLSVAWLSASLIWKDRVGKSRDSTSNLIPEISISNKSSSYLMPKCAYFEGHDLVLDPNLFIPLNRNGNDWFVEQNKIVRYVNYQVEDGDSWISISAKFGMIPQYQYLLINDDRSEVGCYIPLNVGKISYSEMELLVSNWLRKVNDEVPLFAGYTVIQIPVWR